MDNLAQYLSPIELNLSDILLDPNNPRFSELGESYGEIPESRFADQKVQANTFDKMRHSTFAVAELRDTIKTVGFLQMDRIVVQSWHHADHGTKYVVLEGNRRVTALKWLISLEEIGKETFDDDSRENLTKLECLLLDKDIAPTTAHLILPGLRHVSGIKEWGPYQKAKAVHNLRVNGGLSPQEAAQSLGLSTRAANNSYRCFLALENMASDEEFSEFAKPDMYSYFEELFKKPQIRNWLSWDDTKESFEEEANLHEFYSWIIEPDDDNHVHKLSELKSIRDLAKIITDDAAMSVFRSNEGTLTRAIAKYEVDHPEDWFPKITAATSALKSLTTHMIRKMDEPILNAIEALKEQIEQTQSDREKLTD